MRTRALRHAIRMAGWAWAAALLLFWAAPASARATEPAAVADQGAAPAASAAEEAGVPFSISLDRQTLLLKAGDQVQLSATVASEDGTMPVAIQWSTEDPSVLRVSRTGRVTAVAPGCSRVWVSASDGAARAKCAVAVYPAGDLDTIAEEQGNMTLRAFYRAIAALEGRQSPWQSLVCIGDSVTAGVQGGPGLPAWIPNYPLTMESILGVTAYNHGIGGASIWTGGNHAIIDSLDTYEPADAVFVLGGYNDWFYGTECPIGDLDTPGSFTYDFNALCARIREVYPEADVFVVLPPTPHAHVGVDPYYDFSWIKAIEREVAEAHGFHVLNLPAQDVLNGLEEDTWRAFFSDDVHMNDYGYLVLGTIITDQAIRALEEVPILPEP